MRCTSQDGAAAAAPAGGDAENSSKRKASKEQNEEKNEKKKGKKGNKGKKQQHQQQLKVASMDGVTVTIQISANTRVRDVKQAYIEERQLPEGSVSLDLFMPNQEDALKNGVSIGSLELPETRTLFMLHGELGPKELRQKLAAMKVQHAKDLEQLKTTHNEEISPVRAKHLIERSGLDTSHAQKLKPLQDEIKRLQVAH